MSSVGAMATGDHFLARKRSCFDHRTRDLAQNSNNPNGQTLGMVTSATDITIEFNKLARELSLMSDGACRERW